MKPHDSRRLRQFRLWHLLVLMTGAALLFGVWAPTIRHLDRPAQLAAIGRIVVFAYLTFGFAGYLIFMRHKIERIAGPVIEQFESFSSRVWNWVIGCTLWISYLVTFWVQFEPSRAGTGINFVPGSPVLLFFAVSYVVVRGLWGIDPTGLVACENGLIIGALQFLRWNEITRYSWSGKSARELNLFLKQRSVLNLKVNAAFIERLDRILSQAIVTPSQS